MSFSSDPQEPTDSSEHRRASEPGIWTHHVKRSLTLNKGTDPGKMKIDKELTANIGLPLELLPKHEPWPAYVTYTSLMVERLVEKSKARERECMQALEESRRNLDQDKTSGIVQLRRKKLSKTSGRMALKDTNSETVLSLWSAFSTSPTNGPETIHIHTDSRGSPTANYNKIIFSRKPLMRMLPYSSLLASKEKHFNV
uniref:CMT1A duplicated region transcript 4 n=2 Tax=Molossus molossus TaxID=27622 RepID=A0A7J8CX07_MOLMO|nr:CMT1A duplicated region transcript 4 [Molossus molossus]